MQELELLVRALIIDVSKSLSGVLNPHCAGLNLSTELHTSGNRALRAYRQQPFELVCFALQLSDMDGIAFARKILLSAGSTPPRLILITSNEDRQLLSEATKVGITDIFYENQITDLLTQITQWVEHHRLDQPEGDLLYMDEDQAYAATTTKLLKAQGYQVKHVSDVVDALKSLRTDDYDLVITEYDEADSLSGRELIQAIRSREEHHMETPILVLAAMKDRQNKLDVMHSGANDFLDKTDYPEELLIRVGNLVNTRKLYKQVEAQRLQLQTLAMTDQLTGLHNRHYLFEVAPQKISESRRHKHPLSLLIIDLDKFKLINDTHGHHTGDLVLRAVGKLLRQACRNEDIVARFGGEEFVILLTHCSLPRALEKAELIRRAVEDLQPEGLAISTSLGVAAFAEETDTTFNDLFTRADQAVYLAKHNGRNRVEQAAVGTRLDGAVAQPGQ